MEKSCKKSSVGKLFTFLAILLAGTAAAFLLVSYFKKHKKVSRIADEEAIHDFDEPDLEEPSDEDPSCSCGSFSEENKQVEETSDLKETE
jgi:hypothetical protein